MRRGQRDRLHLALEIPRRVPPPSARGRSRYRPLSCPRLSAGPARSNRRRFRWIAARSHRAAHRPRPRRPPRCRRNAAPRSPSARPADATSPPSRSGRGPSTGRRDGNSSCQVAHFIVVFVPKSGAAYMAHSCGAGQCLGANCEQCRGTYFAGRACGQSFPSSARLINRRHALSRSPLSINSPHCPDFRELREPLRAICAGLELKGSVLLAHEGINGTLAGSAEAIGELVEALRDGDLFGGRLDNLELKFSGASADAVSAPENPAEEGDRHPRRRRGRSDAAGRHLCRSGRLERIDRDAGHARDRHPQCIRGRDGHIRRRDRSRHRKLWAIQGIRRASSRSR